MTEKELQRLKALTKKAREAANESFKEKVRENNFIEAGAAHSTYRNLVDLETKFNLMIFDEYLLDKPKGKTINDLRAEYALRRAKNE